MRRCALPCCSTRTGSLRLLTCGMTAGRNSPSFCCKFVRPQMHSLIKHCCNEFAGKKHTTQTFVVDTQIHTIHKFLFAASCSGRPRTRPTEGDIARWGQAEADSQMQKPVEALLFGLVQTTKSMERTVDSGSVGDLLKQ